MAERACLATKGEFIIVALNPRTGVLRFSAWHRMVDPRNHGGARQQESCRQHLKQWVLHADMRDYSTGHQNEDAHRTDDREERSLDAD